MAVDEYKVFHWHGSFKIHGDGLQLWLEVRILSYHLAVFVNGTPFLDTVPLLLVLFVTKSMAVYIYIHPCFAWIERPELFNSTLVSFTQEPVLM